MTEVAFAKSFLSFLDSRPPKLPADHVEDPRDYPARPPYILPKMPNPMTKRASTSSAPGQDPSITVLVKSLRNPPLDIKLHSQSLSTTSILDIKTAVSQQAGGIPVDKLKLLYKKKPVADSKVLKDLVTAGEGSLELSAMVMGGASAIPATSAATTGADGGEAKEAKEAAGAASVNPAEGLSGEDVIKTDAFWTDLKGFLSQRIRDEKVAEALFGQFMASWESR